MKASRLTGPKYRLSKPRSGLETSQYSSGASVTGVGHAESRYPKESCEAITILDVMPLTDRRPS